MSLDSYRPISVQGVGALVGRHEVGVTTRMTMAYAAGIGALDALYLDDLRQDGVVAPLPFVAALEWPVLISSDYLTAIGRDTESAFDGLVHGFQDTTFTRPIRPGMRVEVIGQIVEISATPAGALVVCRISTSDRKDGELVAESWYWSMFRHTAVDGQSSARLPRPALRHTAGLPPGELQESIRIDIGRGQPHVYTECAQIWNPIHTERMAAIAAGLPDIILHGTCTWAMTLQRLVARLGRKDAALPLRRFGARFSGMVVPGTAVTIEHTLPTEGRMDFVVRNSEGDLALSYGVAEA